MARATSSLPEPFSPWISTRPLVGAAMRDLLAQVLDERGSCRRSRWPRSSWARRSRFSRSSRACSRARLAVEQRLLERERLLDEVVGAELGGLDRGLDGAVAGDHHHRGLGPEPLDLGQRLEAVDARHPDVEEDEVGRVLLEARQGLRRRARPRSPDSPRPRAPRGASSGSPARRPRSGCARRTCGLTACTGRGHALARGSSITKRLPCGGLSSTQIVPP